MEINVNFKISATSASVKLLNALLAICESETDEVFTPSDVVIKSEETETPKSENPVIGVVRKKRAVKSAEVETVKSETTPESSPEPAPEKSEKAVDEVFIRSRIVELEAQRETAEEKSEFRKGVKTLLNEIGAGGRIPGLTPEMYSSFLTKLNEL